MREKKWFRILLNGVLMMFAVSNGLKTARPKFKIASSTVASAVVETTTIAGTITSEKMDEFKATTTLSTDVNVTTGHTLTGIPQIDYIWDPNLPRELNGYNLSDYPFYASMPEDIDFKCDGLHDGFYASVPHKCQVYHHCLFGTRYDFLCANFTAFDQKTFICHFVSEVDCANSKNYWHRNDALYKTTTTTLPTTSTSTTTTSTTSVYLDKGERILHRERDKPIRRRRPFLRRPMYDYYYDDYYDDDEYERVRSRVYNRRDYDDYEEKMYRRNRNRDGDFRQRESPNRDRDRFSTRVNRRDSVRGRDSTNDDRLRFKIRDQDNLHLKNPDNREESVDEKNKEERFIDFNEKDSALPSNNGNNQGLSKVSNHQTSRLRLPLKNRRPLQLSQDEKYSYAIPTTSSPPDFKDREDSSSSDDAEENRKLFITEHLDGIRNQKTTTNTSDDFLKKQVPTTNNDDYYYDYEVEDVRPHWITRNRPSRDRDLSDKRHRDRLFRSRYSSYETMHQPLQRQQQGNQNYERQYKRNNDQKRNQFLNGAKSNHVITNSSFVKNQDEKILKLSTRDESSNRDKENINLQKNKLNETREVNVSSEKSSHHNLFTTENYDVTRFKIRSREPENRTFVEVKSNFDTQQNGQKDSAVFSLIETESLPRTLRRPFLPSRGGKSNFRGLLPIGLKIYDSNPEEFFYHPLTSTLRRDDTKEKIDVLVDIQNKNPMKEKIYNNNKSTKDRVFEKNISENNKFDMLPPKIITHQSKFDIVDEQSEMKPTINQSKLPFDQTINNKRKIKENRNRSIDHLLQKDNFAILNSSPNNQKHLLMNEDFKIKQQINEVAHYSIKDFPKSEYDISLNGFILPLHRQFVPSGDYAVSDTRQNNQQQKQLHEIRLSSSTTINTENADQNMTEDKLVKFNAPRMISVNKF